MEIEEGKINDSDRKVEVKANEEDRNNIDVKYLIELIMILDRGVAVMYESRRGQSNQITRNC